MYLYMSNKVSHHSHRTIIINHVFNHFLLLSLARSSPAHSGGSSASRGIELITLRRITGRLECSNRRFTDKFIRRRKSPPESTPIAAADP
jgi:hypothetical protein